MSLRVMATADVHLGMKFASYRSVQTKLIDARFEALHEVVQAANERACNLLVVAGDLFHRVGVASAVILRAAEILREFNGDAIAVLPGNHDYVSSDGDRLWHAFRETVGDHTLLLDSAEPYDLRVFDINAVLLAAPCDSVHGHDHRLSWMEGYTAPEEGLTVIGIAHGSIDGLTLDTEGLYFPMSRRLLASLPPALWIIGHTHRQHDLPQARLVVPGTPEPDGFDFPHAGQAAFIQIDGDEYSVEPVVTGRNRFAEISVDLDRGQEITTQLARAAPADALVRLTLSGALDGGSLRDLHAALDDLRSRLPYLRVDETNLRRLVTQADVDADYATGSYAHRLVSALLSDDDAGGAAAAVELLSAAQFGGSDA